MKEQLKLYRNLGSQLISKGKWFLNKAIPVKKKVFTSEMVLRRVHTLTGIAPAMADRKFYATDMDTWNLIIEYDWTNKKKWIEDYFDCDNFSGSFTAHAADIYGLNTAGRFTCELTDPVTDKHIGYHRAAIIVDKELDCWLLETQTDGLVKIIKGVYPVIGKWKYKPTYISFN